MDSNGLRESTEGVLNAIVGDPLVTPHQRGRADYVGMQDDREL